MKYPSLVLTRPDTFSKTTAVGFKSLAILINSLNKKINNPYAQILIDIFNTNFINEKDFENIIGYLPNNIKEIEKLDLNLPNNLNETLNLASSNNKPALKISV